MRNDDVAGVASEVVIRVTPSVCAAPAELVWQFAHQLELKLPTATLGQLAEFGPRSMNCTADPCGPCAANEPASVLWQSEHIIVCVPTLAFHGTFMAEASSPFFPDMTIEFG